MSPYHVVIITPYYWPTLCASTHLMKALAEGVAAEGHRVTVLTNRPGPGVPIPADDPDLPCRIRRAWNPFIRRLGVLAKCLEYTWFTFFFLLRGLALRRVDVIFVSSTPPLAGLPAALLARLTGAKLVYNLQDLFPDSVVAAGFLRSGGFAYRVLQRAEAFTYRVSDLVIPISPAFAGHVEARSPGTRVATIPNWVDTDEIRPKSDAEDPAISEYRQGRTFVVQYAGNLGYMQDVQILVEAAECLKADAGIGFVFIGEGNAKQAMQDMARQRGLTNCVFLPMQPLERVPAVYNACDVGVVPLKSGAGQTAVPSKTWNYLAAGRPVIGCVEEDTPLAGMIHQSGSGSVVPPGNAARLAEAILAYRDAPEQARADGRRGRDYAEANLSRRGAILNHIRAFDLLLEGRVREA